MTGRRLLAPVALAYGLATAIALLVVFNVLQGEVLPAERQAQTERAEGIARALALSIEAEQLREPGAELQERLVRLVEDEGDIRQAWVLRRTDLPTAMEVVAEARSEGRIRPARTPVDAAQPAEIAVALGLQEASPQLHSSLMGVVPIRGADGAVAGVVGVGVRDDHIRAVDARMFATFLVTLVVTGVAFVLLTALLGRRFGGQWHRVPSAARRPEGPVERLTPRFQRMARHVQQRQVIAASDLVDEAVLDQVLPTRLPQARLAEVGLLIVDVDGADEVARREGPGQVVERINAVLDEVVAAVERHSGVVLRSGGGLVAAVFGAPIPVESPMAAALQCGLELEERLRRMRQEWERSGTAAQGIKTRLGVHGGAVVSGGIGPSGRRGHAAVGDALQLAALLLQLARRLDCSLVLTRPVLESAPSSTRLETTGRSISLGDGKQLRVYRLGDRPVRD